jgi:hypothetical protein
MASHIDDMQQMYLEFHYPMHQTQDLPCGVYRYLTQCIYALGRYAEKVNVMSFIKE